MDTVIRGLGESVPTLLLHSCCAPCSSAVLEELSQYFEITVFYYNPNISPAQEFQKRTEEVQRLIREMKTLHPVHFLLGNYEPERFYEAARGLEQEPERGARCEKCFRLRLSVTAEQAAKGGYDYFTTTLTISPLKNAGLLNEIGEEEAEKHGVRFLPSDFKKKGGYQRSIELSHLFGLYRQDFCGCVFSKAERCKQKEIRMKKGYERIHAEIDLSAIRQNFLTVTERLKPGTLRCAVVKADAYGHGALETAKELEDIADYFAAATPEEALYLKKEGIRKPVLVLGLVGKNRYEEMIREEIRIPAASFTHVKEMSEAAVRTGKSCYVHFKIDTGMGRIGFAALEESLDEIAEAAKLPGIVPEGIFTHLATADMADNSAAKQQAETFLSMVSSLRERGIRFSVVHYANSAASILFDTSDSDMVRVGISMYGLLPSEEADFSAAPVNPALSLQSEICFVKTVPPGTPVGYGAAFVTARESRIGTVSCGYADGYPRTLSNKGEVLIRGKRCPIIGRVCMDQMMVDLTDHPDAASIPEGEAVVLLGPSGTDRITAEELGDLSGRFNYELVCDITRRVPRLFLKEGKVVSEKDWFGL